jgi:poly(A) polymerase
MENTQPIVRTRSEHPISRRDIDPDALTVLNRLSQEGFTAYLVGGGVRDLLRGVRPKDFDVSTDAHPNQVKRLFRNCFLIGRRFRLAHIRFGQKVIETSTFRRNPGQGDEPAAGPGDADLLQHRDNTFGSPEEDALRRDFTINGLFYDIRTFRVLDYVGGLDDLEKRVIRSIGDPDVRFREDPVRMVRAVRFASRLGFSIEPATLRAMLNLHSEIRKASPARLQEEIYRLFGHGVSEKAFRLLEETGLFGDLFPGLAAHEAAAPASRYLLWRCLGAFDGREPRPGTYANSLLWAMLAYPVFEGCVAASPGGHRREINESCAHEAVRTAGGWLALSRRSFAEASRLLAALGRLMESAGADHAAGRRAARIRFMRHELFPAAMLLWEVVALARGDSTGPIHRWKAEAESLGDERAEPACGRDHARHGGAEPGGEEHRGGFRPGRRRRGGRGRRGNRGDFRHRREQDVFPLPE